MLRQGLDYNDVLLVPVPSQVNTREQAEITFPFTARDGKTKDKLPIFSSPMMNISEPILIQLLDERGGFGILHRFIKDTKERVDTISKLNDSCDTFGIAVGSCVNELKFAVNCWNTYPHIEFVCIDVANGYTQQTVDAVKYLADAGVTNIISGNVVTPEGVLSLHGAGSNYVRVGIGAGTQCLTRDVTGVGVPQLTALEWCSSELEYDNDICLISDGGIKGSAEAVKSFAFGADMLMLGSIFGKATELNNKEIMGMASRKHQENQYGKVKSVEGRVSKITEHVPFNDIMNEFIYGIKSACTYLNCFSYMDLYLVDKILTGKGSLK